MPTSQDNACNFPVILQFAFVVLQAASLQVTSLQVSSLQASSLQALTGQGPLLPTICSQSE